MKRKTKNALKGTIKWTGIVIAVLFLLACNFLSGRWMWFSGFDGFMNKTPTCIDQQLGLNEYDTSNYALIDNTGAKLSYKVYKDITCSEYWEERDKYIPREGYMLGIMIVGGMIVYFEIGILAILLILGPFYLLDTYILKPCDRWLKEE